MCNKWNNSELVQTDAYWFMRQWHARVKQERPYIPGGALKKNSQLLRHHITRWRLNMERSQQAYKTLSLAIDRIRTFEREDVA